MGGFFDYGVAAAAPSEAGEAFLEGATETDWSMLVAYGERREVAPEEILFELGDMSRSLIIVLAGTFQASLPGRRRGHRTVAGTITAGSVLGELAFFDGAPRSARVAAVTPGEVLIVQWAAFEKLAAVRPSLAIDMLAGLGQILAARFRTANARANNG